MFREMEIDYRRKIRLIIKYIYIRKLNFSIVYDPPFV